MPKIQIICTSPGMRRLGTAHPASAIYPAGHWSDDDLKAFRGDRSFTVREVDDAESTMSSDDFEIRVANEVSSRVALQVEALQRQFDDAVSARVDEKVAALKEAQAENIEKLEKLLALAQAKQEELLAQLEAAAREEAEKAAADAAGSQDGGSDAEEEKPKGKGKAARAE